MYSVHHNPESRKDDQNVLEHLPIHACERLSLLSRWGKKVLKTASGQLSEIKSAELSDNNSMECSARKRFLTKSHKSCEDSTTLWWSELHPGLAPTILGFVSLKRLFPFYQLFYCFGRGLVWFRRHKYLVSFGQQNYLVTLHHGLV